MALGVAVFGAPTAYACDIPKIRGETRWVIYALRFQDLLIRHFKYAKVNIFQILDCFGFIHVFRSHSAYFEANRHQMGAVACRRRFFRGFPRKAIASDVYNDRKVSKPPEIQCCGSLFASRGIIDELTSTNIALNIAQNRGKLVQRVRQIGRSDQIFISNG